MCTHTTNNLGDYAARCAQLDDLSFLEFCLTTEEARPKHRWNNEHYRYLSSMGRDDRSRVRHMQQLLPCFKGSWIPRLNDDTSADLHCAMVLLLLKPWRYLPNLLSEHTQWEWELSQFIQNADNRTVWIASNFQFVHEARDATGHSRMDDVN